MSENSNMYTTITMSMTRDEYNMIREAWKEWYVSDEAIGKLPREVALGRFCKEKILSKLSTQKIN